jgi:hypothetical protein
MAICSCSTAQVANSGVAAACIRGNSVSEADWQNIRFLCSLDPHTAATDARKAIVAGDKRLYVAGGAGSFYPGLPVTMPFEFRQSVLHPLGTKSVPGMSDDAGDDRPVVEAYRASKAFEYMSTYNQAVVRLLNIPLQVAG